MNLIYSHFRHKHLLGYLLLCCELNLRHPLSLSLNNSNLTDAMNIIHHKQLLIISKINQNIGLARLTFYSISGIYFRIPIQSLELWTLLLSINFKPITLWYRSKSWTSTLVYPAFIKFRYLYDLLLLHALDSVSHLNLLQILFPIS